MIGSKPSAIIGGIMSWFVKFKAEIKKYLRSAG